MTDEVMALGESHVIWAGAAEASAPLDAQQFDYQLAQRIAVGDIEAFEQYYRHYHRRGPTNSFKPARDSSLFINEFRRSKLRCI